ncbi:MAG: hypothetical protein L0G39_21830 [Chryseobacterium sp.]|nr:hypothetical protein [Chryseobacterium sp.]MDN5479575.1 hypothetical protein [Chryseobacterium sp.]
MKHTISLLLLLHGCLLCNPFLSAGNQIFAGYSLPITVEKEFPPANKLIAEIEQSYPKLKFKKEQEVRKTDYYYVNWERKGGMQIFSRNDIILTVNMVIVMKKSEIKKNQTPILIDRLLTDIINKTASDWYIAQLKKMSNSSDSVYSNQLKQKGSLLTVAFDEHTSALTVTLQAI